MHPLIEQNREKIATLCRQYGVKRLEVFGSILLGDFDFERSDVSADSLLVGSHNGHFHATSAFFGRPPLLPLARAAARFAGVLAFPPFAPSCAAMPFIQERDPKIPFISPGR